MYHDGQLTFFVSSLGTLLSSYDVEDKKQVAEFDPQAWLDENPEEEEIESLCKLLTTVGAILDSNQKARAHMDIYFTRMKELAKGQHVTPRMQFMLQVCE